MRYQNCYVTSVKLGTAHRKLIQAGTISRLYKCVQDYLKGELRAKRITLPLEISLPIMQYKKRKPTPLAMECSTINTELDLHY
jgi:hypothetical protein